FFFRPRSRCDPANPSDDGGLEEVVEFCCRRPSLRSRSAICFSASLSCRFFSISSSRNLSLSRLSRSISRSTFRWFSAGGIDGRWRCEAPKHLHCQVFQAKARSKLQILKDLCDATFAGPELLRKSSWPLSTAINEFRQHDARRGAGMEWPELVDLLRQ